MIELSVAILSLGVSAIYLIIGLLVMPNLRLDWMALVGAVLFFVGCALTHLHLGGDLLFGFGFQHGVGWQLVFHIMQAIGGMIFIFKMTRKRLVVKLEGE